MPNVGLWLACFVIGEGLLRRFRPAHDHAFVGLCRLLRKDGLGPSIVGLSSLLFLPITPAASSHTLGWRDTWLTPSWRSGRHAFLIDLLILDLVAYWTHRAHHSFHFLCELASISTGQPA